MPRRLALLVTGFLMLAAVLAAPAAHAAKRVALVIGNETYEHAPQLLNPDRDATAMAGVFKRMGFDEVTYRRNLGAQALRQALLDFERHASIADIAIVFYAGHGIEVDGENYLIPSDARLARASSVEVEAIPLSTITSMISGARKLRLVILDACRNNPFRSRMIADRGGRKRSIGRGLARVEPGDNELIAFAAAGGTEADDGAGKHSPFTAALLKHIETPGLDVQFVFRRVRDEVLAETRRTQTPHLYGTLGGEPIYLGGASAKALPGAADSAHSALRQRLREQIAATTSEATLDTLQRLDPTLGPAIAARRLALLDEQGNRGAATPAPSSPPREAPPTSSSTPAIAWPTAPVSLIVPFSPGGVMDAVARILAQELSTGLGQPFVILNVPGAGGLVGAAQGAKAAPDGRTFVLGSAATHALAPLLQTSNQFDPGRDLAPVGIVSETPIVVVVKTGSRATSLRSLGSLATTERKGSLSFATTGVRTLSHLACVHLNAKLGINGTHVPFRGSRDAIGGVAGGHVDYSCADANVAENELKAGNLKAIAVLGARRLPRLPDVATAQEQGEDVVAGNWIAVFAPRDTPATIVRALSKSLSAATGGGTVPPRLAILGLEPVPPERATPEYLDRFLNSEIEKWGAVIRAAGLKP